MKTIINYLKLQDYDNNVTNIECVEQKYKQKVVLRLAIANRLIVLYRNRCVVYSSLT